MPPRQRIITMKHVRPVRQFIPPAVPPDLHPPHHLAAPQHIVIHHLKLQADVPDVLLTQVVDQRLVPFGVQRAAFRGGFLLLEALAIAQDAHFDERVYKENNTVT
jgi:hypothetical protein